VDIPAPASTQVSGDGGSVKSFLLGTLEKIVDAGVDVGRTYVRERVIPERAARTAQEIEEGTSDGPQVQPSQNPTSQAAVESVPASQTLSAIFGSGATLSTLALVALIVLGIAEVTD